MIRKELSIAFQTDKRAVEYRALARQAEEAGFDVLSMYSDLLFQPPIVPLALAAQATSRIRLGPASLNPYTLHPVEIAGQMATLDEVSNGRAYLGLSRGAWLDTLGIQQDRPISRMIEALDVIQHLLKGEREPYVGKHFQLEASHVLAYEPRRREIPILLGSWGPQLIRALGSRVCELKLGGSSNPEMLPVVKNWLGEAENQVGIVFGAVTVVDEDQEQARQCIRREMALYLPVVARLDPTVEIDPALLEHIQTEVRQGKRAAAGALIPDELIDRFSFAGTPFDIVRQCEALFEAGAARIEFGTPHGRTTASGLKLLTRKVLPALEHWRS